MVKLDYRPRILDDELVKDGLCAAGALDDVPESRSLSFVVGGVATQSYLPTICRRPTADIDLAILRPLTYADFKEFSKAAQEFLQDNGYELDLKKGHTSNQLIYTRNGETAILEFPRRNELNYQKRADRLKRECEHTRKKIIEGRSKTCRFAGAEDIAVPKIVRCVGSLSRNPEFCTYVQDSKPLAFSRESVHEELESIRELREEAVAHAGDPRIAERLRFVSDLFDVRALSTLVGFNEGYLEEALGSWAVLTEKTAARDLLVNYVFPNMSK